MPKRLIQDVIAGKTPVTAASTTTVLDAARLMDKSNVASILIVGKDGALEGIFTERDLLRRVVAVGGAAFALARSRGGADDRE